MVCSKFVCACVSLMPATCAVPPHSWPNVVATADSLSRILVLSPLFGVRFLEEEIPSDPSAREEGGLFVHLGDAHRVLLP